MKRVLHELRVHQVELELQNEQLLETQVELDRERARYQDLYELAPVGYVTLDEAGCVVEANRAAYRLLRGEPASVLGSRLTAFVAAADQDTLYLFVRRALRQESPQTCEVRLRATVSPMWLRLDATRAADDSGAPSAHVTLTDVTEARRAEQLISDALAVRDTAEAVALVGSWGLDLLSGETRLSPGMLRLLDARGGASDLRTLLPARAHPLDRERVTAYLRGLTLDPGPTSLEFRIVRNDGRECILEGKSVTQHDAEGRPAEVVGFFRDVTEQRRLEADARRLNDHLEELVAQRTAQLSVANRELESFVYAAAHDLRAPLRAIDGFSQLVATDAADKLGDDDKKNLQRVRAAAQRMGLLIDHLMALSRASRQDLHLERVDVSALAAEVCAEVCGDPPERPLELVIAPGLSTVADRTVLRVVLVNLLGNAWKYTSRHASARIEVGAVDTQGETAFFVRDDGAGFRMEAAAQVFGPFQRLHDPGDFPGDGIGLAIVQRIVARHGGRVWAEAAVEQGATFYFTLGTPDRD